jgi:hypothetical protein
MRTAVALLLCTAATAAAQEVMVGAHVAQADHYLAGDPLTGVAVRLITPLRLAGGAVYVRVAGAESRSERFGSPCGGYVPPGVCTAQPVEDHTRVTSADFGLTSALLTRSRFDISMDIEVGAARWRGTSRGQSSGETGNARETHLGAGLGFRTAVRPARRVPLAIELGAGVGASNKPPGYEVVDGYTPFAQLITQVRYHFGAAWRF